VRVAVARECREGETRVAVTPEAVQRLVRAGHEVQVEAGAGWAGGFPDEAYAKAGARVEADRAKALAGADVVARVQPPSVAEAEDVPAGAVVVGFLYPLQNLEAVRTLAARGASAFALDLLPRVTRAQSMDALSSMSTVSGYRAALLAAEHAVKFFPMLMTAAGTVPPARVVVVGAGVAGLQAIATCRRLGAVVEAYDVRKGAREEAKSLGASVIEADLGESGEGEGGYAKALSAEAEARLKARLAERIRAADVVITTALVPGRPAPRLVDAATVDGMKPGSVVVDLAAETGGNCEGTQRGEVVRRGGTTIVGPVNVPATMPGDASRLYAKNIEEVVKHLTPPVPKEGPPPTEKVRLDLQDEITAGALVLLRGEVRHAPTKDALAAGGSR
jgi:NAD(P) transhydrogenase subunit alpha